MPTGARKSSTGVWTSYTGGTATTASSLERINAQEIGTVAGTFFVANDWASANFDSFTGLDFLPFIHHQFSHIQVGIFNEGRDTPTIRPDLDNLQCKSITSNIVP